MGRTTPKRRGSCARGLLAADPDQEVDEEPIFEGEDVPDDEPEQDSECPNVDAVAPGAAASSHSG
eukprot:5744774-Amphidinium_carterae.1